MKLTGLSKPTVLRLVGALEGEGLIRRSTETPPTRRGAGRTPVRYELNPDAAYVVGIEVDGEEIAVGLADLSGALKSALTTTVTVDGNKPLTTEVGELLRSVSASAGIALDQVSTITVGAESRSGPHPSTSGSDEDVAALASWIRSSLHVPVQVEDRTDLAALAELEDGAARNARSFVLLTLGRSVHMAHVVDGKLHHHSRGGTTAVAHLPVGDGPGSWDPSGAAGAGAGIALGWAASSAGLSAMAQRHSGPRSVDDPPQDSTTDPLPSPEAVHDIYEAATRGNPDARQAVEEQAAFVARAVVAITCTLDPDLVLLGGEIGSHPLLVSLVTQAAARLSPWAIDIQASALGRRAGMIGAIHHARRIVPRMEAAAVSARVRSQGRI